MKKDLFFRFFLGLICLLLLNSIIYITPVNASSQSVKFVEQIAQTPSLSQSESIKQLIATGKVRNGNLEDVNITKTLIEAGAVSVDQDYQEYFLSKFDGVLDLEGTNLRGADFKRLRAKEINLKNADLFGANLSDVFLEKADFSGARMLWGWLNKARLENANFQGASLLYTDMFGGYFAKANFSNAAMDGVDIRLADFTGANFGKVTIYHDGPKNPKFFGAIFTDANLTDSEIYFPENDEQFKVFFCRTIMSDGIINNRDCDGITNNGDHEEGGP